MSKTEIPKTIGRPAKNALEAQGYKYLEDLANVKESELQDMHGIGQKAIGILKTELSKNNILSQLTPS
ncbi:MAG: DNA-directed RNA polymerase subunit alpha C-terminal domain-containing protein [Patescibacteria group bacterium]